VGNLARVAEDRAAAAGIPLIASVSAPTTLAVTFAEANGVGLAAFAREHASAGPKDPLSVASSDRNRFAGLVTRVVTDTVMAQVEMQCGPFTVVSLMSSDAVRELKLEPGSIAVAVVKATTVIVETPGGQS